MYDPMTVAFEIKYPWRDKSTRHLNLWPKGYRHTFITIWHVDPESDGTDDSCGWSRPKLSKDQLQRIHSFAEDEAREPYYQKFLGKKIENPTDAETLLRQAILFVSGRLTKEYLCKPPIHRVTFSEASEWACDLLNCSHDNLRSSLAFLPGYHSNRKEDRESDRAYHAEQLFLCIARYILRKRRRWHQHPKWHLHHWKIQIHPLEAFKRWAFTRCATCGGRFKWGQTGWTNQWDSDGPQWFRSEQDLHHDSCGGQGVADSDHH